jgi:hypothetical protein
VAPTLQKRLQDIEDRLRYLKDQFPEWRAWGSGYGPGNEPPAYYAEIRRLEEDREVIVLKLSKRVKPQTSAASAKTKSRPAIRLRATINSLSAARRMETYLESKGIGQTEFAVQVGTTDRTLRTFRRTGKVRRDIFRAIAKAMGTTTEALFKRE